MTEPNADYAGCHKQGCVLRDDHHEEPCLTALPPWWDPECPACDRLYGEPRYSCEDVCMVECIGVCGVAATSSNDSPDLVVCDHDGFPHERNTHGDEPPFTGRCRAPKNASSTS